MSCMVELGIYHGVGKYFITSDVSGWVLDAIKHT